MLNKPFEDEEMRYDKENHRYVLTQAGAQKVKFSVEFYGETLDYNLDDMSENVYQYIYSIANTHNIPFIEFKLACDSELKPYVKRMLIAQLKYDMASKGNSIANDVLLDKENADAYYERRVAPNVKSIISQLHLDYAGKFNQVLPADKYIRWDY